MTVSPVELTVIETSTGSATPVLSSRSGRFVVAKPGAEKVTVYTPGRRSTILYCPMIIGYHLTDFFDECGTARFNRNSWHRRTGWIFTDPAIVPVVVDWASARNPENSNASAVITRTPQSAIFFRFGLFIIPLVPSHRLTERSKVSFCQNGKASSVCYGDLYATLLGNPAVRTALSRRDARAFLWDHLHRKPA